MLRNDSESGWRGGLCYLKKRKHPAKRQKQQPTENQKNTKYQNAS